MVTKKDINRAIMQAIGLVIFFSLTVGVASAYYINAVSNAFEKVSYKTERKVGDDLRYQ